MKLYQLVVYLLLAWVVLGSAYLFFITEIDGRYINPPFTMRVDPMALKTDKTLYHAGDTISIAASVCRNRSYHATTSWRLVDDTYILLVNRTTIGTPGCVSTTVPVGVVPPNIYPGTFHLEGSTEIEINPHNTLYYSFRSQDFTIR
jgi:hypothetical protein